MKTRFALGCFVDYWIDIKNHPILSKYKDLLLDLYLD